MANAKIKFKDYGKMPEMRILWLVGPLLIAAFILALMYFPGVLRAVGAAVFLLSGAAVFFLSRRAARANFSSLQSKNRLNSVIDHLLDAVIAHDDELRILVFNRAAERLFQLSASEVLGQVFSPERAAKDPRFKLLGQAMFPSLAPIMVKKSKPGAYPQVVDIKTENPQRELQIVVSQITDEQGRPSGLARMVRDKTREAQLLKSKSEFITIASHQLRTPLTAVSWVFQELQKSSLNQAQAQETIKTGALAAAKLSKIINDFLDIAKLEEGKFGYTFENTDLNEFIGQVVKEASAIARQYKVSVYFEPSSEKIVAPIDKAKMGIVFSNLLDNAIKYNVENGSVTVNLKKISQKPLAEVEISDTGVGISDEEMKSIFTKFFRTKAGVQKDATGSGLGLYLTRNIVHQHGGSIFASSTPGRGTTFTFTLPLDINMIPQAEAPSLV